MNSLVIAGEDTGGSVSFSIPQSSAKQTSTEVYFERCGDVLLWFMDHMEASNGYSEAYMSTASSYICSQLLGVFETTQIGQINREHLDVELVQPLLNRYAPSTVHGVFSVLKTAFSCASKSNRIHSNPMQTMSFREFYSEATWKETPSRLTAGDIPTLVSAIKTQSQLIQCFVFLQMLHATRAKETTQIEWNHFTEDFDRWSLPVWKAKEGEVVQLPLSSYVAKLLKSLPRDGKYLFSHNAVDPISTRTVERWYQTISKKAGIKFSSEDLRKLASTSWQELNIERSAQELFINRRNRVFRKDDFCKMKTLLKIWEERIGLV